MDQVAGIKMMSDHYNILLSTKQERILINHSLDEIL